MICYGDKVNTALVKRENLKKNHHVGDTDSLDV